MSRAVAIPEESCWTKGDDEWGDVGGALGVVEGVGSAEEEAPVTAMKEMWRVVAHMAQEGRRADVWDVFTMVGKKRALDSEVQRWFVGEVENQKQT